MRFINTYTGQEVTATDPVAIELMHGSSHYEAVAETVAAAAVADAATAKKPGRLAKKR